jgi:hypothetical protein
MGGIWGALREEEKEGGMNRNRPSRQGELLGRELARLTDNSLTRLFPNAPDRRCRSCAFRLGTYPNHCWQTVVDAFGCVDSGETFHCHERIDDDDCPEVCAGYLIAEAAAAQGRKAG